MKSRFNLYLIAAVLILLGGGLAVYKHLELGFPLWPSEQKTIWTVEAKVSFDAKGEPLKVSLAVPGDGHGYEILGQDYASPGYGFFLNEKGVNRQAEWTAREATGKQTIYYTAQVIRATKPEAIEAPQQAGSETPTVPEVVLDEPYATAAASLIKEVRERSADTRSFTIQLLKKMNSKESSQEVDVLKGMETKSKSMGAIEVDLLHLEGIPARLVRGIYLVKSSRNQKSVEMLEVYDGKQWLVFDHTKGEEQLPENFLLWQYGGESLIDVVGGEKSKVTFSVSASTQSTRSVAIANALSKDAALVNFSIYSLPIAEQNAYKSILLVPIGTLIVVFLRIVVGIRTSGTFMPILMALAFIQTTLITGLISFIVIVALGLWIRSTLSRLNLLLVARISSVVIVVIGIMAGITIISYKLGFNQILTITFFPMIILAWTIERMSVIWEEDGMKEVVIQGGGSLIVASIAYVVMTNRLVEHLTFNFPELLLVILALNLLMGQYTGYRLVEFYRFSPFVKELRK